MPLVISYALAISKFLIPAAEKSLISMALQQAAVSAYTVARCLHEALQYVFPEGCIAFLTTVAPQKPHSTILLRALPITKRLLTLRSNLFPFTYPIDSPAATRMPCASSTRTAFLT